MVKRTLLLAGLATCVALYAFAGTEPTTTINGTLTNPFGATAGTGTVSCALSEAGTWDNDGTATAVTTPVSGTVASDGTVSLVLTPNDAITPTGTYWVCDWVETGVTRWRDQPVLPSDPDPIAIDGVPRRVTPPPDSIPVYAPFINRQPNYPNEIIFDSNSDTLWDVSLYDDGDNSGIILRNGLPFIQFGVGAKLKIKLCGVGLDAGFFYDEDDDGTFDAADDFCWGKGGYDQDCNCVADTGGGSGDMTKAVYDTDNDSTVDLAEALATPVTQVDIDGDGTREINKVSTTLFVDANEDGTNDWSVTSGQIAKLGSNLASFGGDDGIIFYSDLDEDGTGYFQVTTGSGGIFYFDGSLGDCDGDGSALGYDVTAGTLVCGDDDSGGASTQVDIDGDGTQEISLATSTLSIDPDEDGTAEAQINSSGDYSGKAATATALAANGANCSAGQYPLGVDASGATESCTAVPVVYLLSSWHRENVPQSAATYMSPVDAQTNVALPLAPAATIVSLACTNAVITTGTITYTAQNTTNNTDLTVQQTTSTGSGAVLTDTTCTSNCSVSAGSYIRVRIDSSANLAGTTTDPNCTVILSVP